MTRCRPMSAVNSKIIAPSGCSPNVTAAGCMPRRDLEPHLRQTLLFHSQNSRRAKRHIDNPAPPCRFAILDRHPRRAVVCQIGYLDAGSQRQDGAGGHRTKRMERLSIRHEVPVLTPTIPARSSYNSECVARGMLSSASIRGGTRGHAED
jgi:hypothetical protein